MGVIDQSTMADALLFAAGLGRLRPSFQGLDIQQFLSLGMRVSSYDSDAEAEEGRGGRGEGWGAICFQTASTCSRGRSATLLCRSAPTPTSAPL